MRVHDEPITFMETKLTWMKENHPEYLLELYNDNELGGYLHKTIQDAKNMEKYLEEQGNLNEFQIEEVIMEMLAPAEDLELENDKIDMISEKQFNQIINEIIRVKKKRESNTTTKFKPWTEEAKKESLERWREAARIASEDMEKGIYPNHKSIKRRKYEEKLINRLKELLSCSI